jgi:cell division protein FtsI (penicillin-binding protein 3)
MRSSRAARTRVVLLALACFVWFSLISYRLVDLQVVRHLELAGKVERQHQRTLEVTPKRGVIYDRNRRELAVSIGVDSVFVVPADVEDAALAARALAPVLELDSTEIEHRLRSSQSFVWLKRKIDAATAEAVGALKLKGIHFEREHKRFYPKRELAAHVIGFTGLDEDGLGGLEYAFDKKLRGASERVVVTADGRRRTYRRSDSGVRGSQSLVLTIDENIQYIAERELAKAIKETGAASGSIIVEDPGTGEVLAMANYPTFNPNSPTAVPTFYHVNRSVSLPYEPGSTFKVVTVSAALEEGLTTPLEIVDCQMGGIVLAGHLIRDWQPFGMLSVREIIHHSSDVGTIKLGLRVGERRLHEHIRRWGFGEKTGIELPAESRGILRDPGEWSQISIGAISMGQEVAVTPIQLAAAISTVANGGEWKTPHVVKEILDENGVAGAAQVGVRRIIPEGVAEEMRRMFAGVVTQGTGTRAQLAGYSAAGKTGTAQKIDQTGSYSETDFIASFVGFAPVMNPAITVVVTIDSPRGEENGGGEVAAPVFRRVAEGVLAYLNVPADLPGATPRTPDRRRRTSEGNFSTKRITAISGSEALAGQFPVRTESAPTAVIQPAWNRKAPAAELPRNARSIVTRNAESVEVPDFTGASLRDVVVRSARLGLNPVLAGTGVAVAQKPAPGERVPRGSRVHIEFRPSAPPAPTRAM